MFSTPLLSTGKYLMKVNILQRSNQAIGIFYTKVLLPKRKVQPHKLPITKLLQLSPIKPAKIILVRENNALYIYNFSNYKGVFIDGESIKI